MAGTLVIDTLKSSTANPPVFQNTSGIEAGQLCRAWVCFNGSSASIRASHNVSSVTRSATGAYSVNLSASMSDANYSVVAGCEVYAADTQATAIMVNEGAGGATARTVNSIPLSCITTQTKTLVDKGWVNVAIFR